MAGPANGHEFFSLLEKSQLLDAELIEKLRPQMATHRETEPKRLATTLLKNQLITEYHARQLIAGKYKGFYLARYKLLELLGQGGMGRVYLAEQISMERLVAVKLINGQKNKKQQEQAMARFRREAKAVAALRHPNIIQAFDYADEHGIPYIVMEYVEGIDTARIVHKFGPIPYQIAAEYGRQSAEGLEHAHRAGLVHRDIKPGNLLVDSSGQIKILDLGLVSAFDQKQDDSLTVDQDQLGTVDYIAPEQALDSKNVDARADLYSLGATLYSIMTGRVLFPDKSTAQKLLLHQTTAPEPLQNLVPEIPAGLAAIITKMLEKDPKQRYQSAHAVAEALRPFAIPKAPPYEMNAIKFRRQVYEGFLGKSPEPSQITVPTLGSQEPDKPVSTPKDGSSQTSGKLRQASMINVESSESIDDFSSLENEDYTQLVMEMPSIISRKAKKKKAKKKTLEPIQIVAVVGSLLGIVFAMWFGARSLRALAEDDQRYQQVEAYAETSSTAPANSIPTTPSSSTTPPNTTASSPTSAPTPPPAPVYQTSANPSSYQAVDLTSVANTVTTKGMFNEESNLGETLIFPSWDSKTVQNVPFTLIDPQGQQRSNAVLLHGTAGSRCHSRPRLLNIIVNSPGQAIFILGGVGGYCYPATVDQVGVMIVRVRYQDGQTEDHRFVNGVHFADYIRRVDVPESLFAFDLQGKQVRMLQLKPQQRKVIQSIDLIKDGDNATCPVVMAITVQQGD